VPISPNSQISINFVYEMFVEKNQDRNSLIWQTRDFESENAKKIYILVWFVLYIQFGTYWDIRRIEWTVTKIDAAYLLTFGSSPTTSIESIVRAYRATLSISSLWLKLISIKLNVRKINGICQVLTPLTTADSRLDYIWYHDQDVSGLSKVSQLAPAIISKSKINKGF